jgi:uncharacterized protein YlxP (DUF503 family)
MSYGFASQKRAVLRGVLNNAESKYRLYISKH